MNKLPPLEIVNFTDAGMSRSYNEDRHAADADAGLAIRPDKPTADSPQVISLKLAWQAGTPMVCAMRMTKAAHGVD